MRHCDVGYSKLPSVVDRNGIEIISMRCDSDKSNYDDPGTSGPPSSKKQKMLQYKQLYLKKWELNFLWVRPHEEDENSAYCKICNRDFSIK